MWPDHRLDFDREGLTSRAIRVVAHRPGQTSFPVSRFAWEGGPADTGAEILLRNQPRVWEIDRVAADLGRPEINSRGEMREAVRRTCPRGPDSIAGVFAGISSGFSPARRK